MKYKNKKTTIQGITFDSQIEAQRYIYLYKLIKAKRISELELQPKFLLLDGFNVGSERIRPIHYIADFQYKIDDCLYVEDTKGMQTDAYKLKKKLFLAYLVNLNKENNNQIVFMEVFKDFLVKKYEIV